MKSPLVSIIITCFNRQTYIAQAIESALNQTMLHHEIIVIDDGSTDDSAKVVQAYGNRVQYFHQHNQGASKAKNVGVERACGEYISFLDSDDFWPSDKLQIQLKHFTQSPAVDILHGYAQQFVDADLTPEEKAQLFCPPEPMAAPVSGTLLVRKEVFKRVGGFREDLLVGIDIEWHLRAKSMGLRIETLPDILLHRRIHKTNSGATHRTARQQHLSILKEHLDRRRQAMGEK
ncbi:glycosyltransferase family 2 protein [Ottowia thiooxydans]|uniref:Glycosyltransferase involved in cell wall biosynthesis n=1 Tax=Ottowia thiooxydans TaxID=219182 RepID=A0ABV2QDN0_9BURK